MGVELFKNNFTPGILPIGKIFWNYLVLVSFLPSLLLSLLLDPGKLAAGEYSFMPSCFFKNVFLEDCPGCGLARSWTLFAHGDLNASEQAHSSGYVIFMLIFIISIATVYKWCRVETSIK